MRRILGLFLINFGMVGGCFLLQSCTTPNLVWCTSSGIVTYNRHTGQFEMLWENEQKRAVEVHDTIYVLTDSLSTKPQY